MPHDPGRQHAAAGAASDVETLSVNGLLRDRAIERVVVVGLATDYCVRATALDAARLGYRTSVLTDAVAAVDLAPGDGVRAIDEMRVADVSIEQTAEEPAEEPGS